MGKRESLVKLFYTLMERKDKDVTATEIANAINVSIPTVTRFLDCENELSFGSLVKAVRYLSPENHVKVMEDVIPLLEAPASQRSLLEYFSVNRQLDKLNAHIKELKDSDCRVNKDWAKAYEIVSNFQSRNVGSDELMSSIRKFKAQSKETKAILVLIECRVLYRMREFDMMFRLAKSSEKEVEALKNDYIRDCYTARLCELFAQGYLYVKADVKKARFYANNVISLKISADFISHGYYTIGTSFMYENYDEALANFTKYKELLKERGRDKLVKIVERQDIPFLQNVWGVKPENFDHIDETEKAHYYAIVGESDKVASILDNASESPFRTYYRGLASKNLNTIYESMVKFMKNGDKLHANLARRELHKSDTFRFVANTLYEIA